MVGGGDPGLLLMRCAWWVEAGAAAPDCVDDVGSAASGVCRCLPVTSAVRAARLRWTCTAVAGVLVDRRACSVEDHRPSLVACALLVTSVALWSGCGAGPGEALGHRRRPRH